MAVAAIHLGEVTDVYRVLKLPRLHRDRSSVALLLAQNRVAGIALLGNNFPLRAYVLTVVAAEAAAVIEVSDVIGMGLPVQPHLGKGRALIDFLHFIDCAPDVELLAL